MLSCRSERGITGSTTLAGVRDSCPVLEGAQSASRHSAETFHLRRLCMIHSVATDLQGYVRQCKTAPSEEVPGHSHINLNLY